MLLLNSIQVMESISGSVVPLAMFYSDCQLIVQLLLIIQLKQVNVKKATQQNNLYIMLAFFDRKNKSDCHKGNWCLLSIANLPVYHYPIHVVSLAMFSPRKPIILPGNIVAILLDFCGKDDSKSHQSELFHKNVSVIRKFLCKMCRMTAVCPAGWSLPGTRRVCLSKRLQKIWSSEGRLGELQKRVALVKDLGG